MTIPVALTYPPCFDSEASYQQWVTAYRNSNEERRGTYCSDCSPEYQAEMVRAGRCLWPGTTFVRLPTTGETVGIRA